MMHKSTGTTTVTKTCLFAATMLLASVTHAGDSDIVDAYLKAYSDIDVKKMGEFYAEDAKFRDPTSEA